MDTHNAFSRLFSPLPTFSDVNYAARSSVFPDNATLSNSYSNAKEGKVIVERKLLCIKERMDHHKYVLMSELYDQEDNKKSKA